MRHTGSTWERRCSEKGRAHNSRNCACDAYPGLGFGGAWATRCHHLATVHAFWLKWAKLAVNRFGVVSSSPPSPPWVAAPRGSTPTLEGPWIRPGAAPGLEGGSLWRHGLLAAGVGAAGGCVTAACGWLPLAAPRGMQGAARAASS